MSDIVIKKLDFPNNVREKPGMYVASTTNSTVIVREMIDNALDELLNKYAKNVRILSDNKNYWFSVMDDGRGIPIYLDDKHPGKDQEITIDLFGSLHTSGKFDAEETTLGTHGLGVSATNALSEHFIVVVDISRNRSTKANPKWIDDKIAIGGRYYLQHNSRGLLVHKDVYGSWGEVSEYLLNLGVSESALFHSMDNFSSLVMCKPDSVIFSDRKSLYNDRELKLSKMLDPEQHIHFNDTEIQPFNMKTDSFKGVKFLDDAVFELSFSFNSEYEYHGRTRTSKNEFKVAFGYSQSDYNMASDGSVNTLDTTEGYHVNTLGKFIQRGFNECLPDMDAKDATYGLRYFVLVTTNAAEYTSQDKVKLGRIYGLDEKELYAKFLKEFKRIVRDNSDYFNGLCIRINEYKATIGALSQKALVKSVVVMGDDKRNAGLGAKVFDCSSRDREKCELFIVEGKSAAGSLLQARDTKLHAILPLRGKVLNASGVELETALKNKEILSMINVIGCGVHPYVDIKQRRYGKIIVASDSDIDGLHIQVLVLGAFSKFLPEIIESGMLFIGLAPLYEQVLKGETKYYWLDKMEGFQETKSFNRYKGLGSCPPKTLYNTLLDPAQRRLIQITPENIDKAVEMLQSAYVKRELMIESGVFDTDVFKDIQDNEIDDIIKYNPNLIDGESLENMNEDM